MARRDWLAWHEPYDDPGSPLSRRLATVQHHLRQTIEARSGAATTVLSLCAGQGHDVIGVLAELPERSEVTATLVEFDHRNVAVARQAVAAASLDQVEIREADAGTTDSMVGAVPADVVLVCGVSGNITDADIERTIGALPSLCAAGATVIWTRHRRPPDLTPTVRGWFVDAGFEEAGFDFPDDVVYGVGVHRLARPPDRFEAGRRLFTFVGYDTLLADQT